MPVLILVVVVIFVGVVIALRSAASPQPNASFGAERTAPALGLWCFVCGLVALAGVAMIGQATYGWLLRFDPPGWLWIVTFWMFPAGLIASAVLGALSLQRNAGRRLGITGLALSVVSVAAFFALVMSVDY